MRTSVHWEMKSQQPFAMVGQSKREITLTVSQFEVEPVVYYVTA